MRPDDRTLRVSPIEDGTVIDHVPAGTALTVLELLRIDGSSGATVSLGMNVPSETLGRKDIVKVEDRELSQGEADVLALIAPDATINIIRECDVVEKHSVERPDRVEGVLSCPNGHCITAAGEPCESRFDVFKSGVRCTYCGTIVRDEVGAHLTAV